MYAHVHTITTHTQTAWAHTHTRARAHTRTAQPATTSTTHIQPAPPTAHVLSKDDWAATSPNTTCFPVSFGSGANAKKNCDVLVFFPLLHIPTVPLFSNFVLSPCKSSCAHARACACECGWGTSVTGEIVPHCISRGHETRRDVKQDSTTKNHLGRVLIRQRDVLP